MIETRISDPDLPGIAESPFRMEIAYSDDPSLNATVISPALVQAAPRTVYVERANPVIYLYH